MSGVPTATWIGRELASGRYRVDALLGEGGMGAVYRAWDKNLSTEVVIKVPHAAMLQDAEFAARFAREISSLVKLSHPHIVKVSDVGEQDGLPFAVMQFLTGGSLEDRQKTGPNRETRSLPPDSLKSWLPSIAEALDFVHSQGYIHRDVKPANILFDAHGHAYLSDFGIAKSAVTGQAASTKTLTGSGMVIGTPEYMAPELIMGQSCDGRVDQYALAVTVFEMLAGRRPFEDSTSTALYVQHATAEPPDLAKLSPDVSPAIATAIHRVLSKSPEQRFASCRAFATVLLGAVETFAASQPESVDTKCPVCQSSLKLADRMRGKQLRCAGCHSLLDVSDDLRLMPVLSSANETVARATTRLASGTRGQAIISAVEADDSYRLQPDHVPENKSSEPVPVKSPAAATQRAASLDEATLRSMSGKTIRPSMLPSPKTMSPATQHEPQTAARPLMSVVGKLLSQFKSDFQAFARRYPTRIAAVVWGLVLVSIPPLMMLIFQTERDDSSVDAKLQSDSSATTSASQPPVANQPMPDATSGFSPSVDAKVPSDSSATTSASQPSDAKPPPPIASEPERRAGEEREDNGLKMKFCWCSPGNFMMGSPTTEIDRNKNEGQVLVTLTKGFWMGKFEVTQGEWQQIMGTTLTQQKVKSKTNTYGEITGRGSRHPMYFVNHDEAAEFCVKLSEQERRAGRLPNDWRYKLPTEAQWEYACRAGTLTATAFGDSLSSTLANFNGNFPAGGASKGPNLNRTIEVGSYKPNSWGLCDMHGNVIEICEDWYVEKLPGGRDPVAVQASGTLMGVARSGAWNGIGGLCRSAFRSAYLPGSRHASVGFRVALVPEQPQKTSSAPPQSAVAKPKGSETVPSEKTTVNSDKLISTSTGMEFVLIPAGEFLMGASTADVRAAIQSRMATDRRVNASTAADVRVALQDDDANFEEYLKSAQPQHPVRITKPFYIGMYAVTQEEFEKVLGRNPSRFSATGSGSEDVSGLNTSRFPVENVTWFDAIEFCNKMSEAAGRTPYYRLTNIERDDDRSIKSATVTEASRTASAPGLSGYRLPTEAEWEYACRAGTTTAFHFGNVLNGDKANVNGNYPFGTTTKGTFLARTTAVDDSKYPKNAFGLAQMHGNVWEWCEDVYDERAYSVRSQMTATLDPLVTSGPESRVLRGGSWLALSWYHRSASRARCPPGIRKYMYGIRVVCSSLP